MLNLTKIGCAVLAFASGCGEQGWAFHGIASQKALKGHAHKAQVTIQNLVQASIAQGDLQKYTQKYGAVWALLGPDQKEGIAQQKAPLLFKDPVLHTALTIQIIDLLGAQKNGTATVDLYQNLGTALQSAAALENGLLFQQESLNAAFQKPSAVDLVKTLLTLKGGMLSKQLNFLSGKALKKHMKSVL